MILEEKTTLNLLWTSLLVEEFLRLGVSHFCISPGSWSAPLACAVHMNPKAKMIVHFDERGSAFQALGLARATGKPAVWITTSGTAVAHAYPALIEASNDRVPLILLTADRPPELRDTGAHQVIDQVKMFGDYCRWFFDLPAPSQEVSAQSVLTTVDQAYYRAVNGPRGPVHLNCMFRYPLAPEDDGKNYSKYLVDLADWKSSEAPFTFYANSKKVPSEENVQELVRRIKKARKGLIVVGKLSESVSHAPLIALFSRLGWPVFPDITSGLRFNKANQVVHFYDQVLLSEDIQQNEKPDVVIHLGGQIVSKRLQMFLESISSRDYLLIKESPQRQDPGHQVSFSLEADLEISCKLLVEQFDGESMTEYATMLKARSEQIAGVVHEFCDNENKLSEAGVANCISQTLPQKSGLYLGSSMPIRDMDMYATASGAEVRIASNRGANGIDGNIATAAGFARGLGATVTVITGDLAFLHDFNSLSLLRDLEHPLVLIVINNNGGGMFSFYPIAKHKEVFEPCFGTPHDVRDFSKAAELFGLNYARPEEKEGLLSAYKKALSEKRSTIIEVVTDREENLAQHSALQEMIKKL